MVRINLINPKHLTDQHLVAEYAEILMLLGHVKRHPEINNQPKQYCLGTGHITFFKNKLVYLKKRHDLLKKEMIKRGFEPKKIANIEKYPKKLKQDYRPSSKAKAIIKKRLMQKICLKPKFYRYHGTHRNNLFFINMIKKSN